MAFVTGMRFLKVHVFPYSRREGTAAYDFADQLPEHEKEARSRRMTAAVEEVRACRSSRYAGPQGQRAAGNAAVRHNVHRLHEAVPACAGQRTGHKTGDIVAVHWVHGTGSGAGRRSFDLY